MEEEEEDYEKEMASRALNKEKKARDFSSIMTAAVKGGGGQATRYQWGKPDEENAGAQSGRPKGLRVLGWVCGVSNQPSGFSCFESSLLLVVQHR